MEFLLLGHRRPSWRNVPSGYVVPQLKQPAGNNSHPNFVVVVVVEWRDGGEGPGCFPLKYTWFDNSILANLTLIEGALLFKFFMNQCLYNNDN